MEEKKLNRVENPTPASVKEEQTKHIILRKLEEVTTTCLITDPVVSIGSKV